MPEVSESNPQATLSNSTESPLLKQPCSLQPTTASGPSGCYRQRSDERLCVAGEVCLMNPKWPGLEESLRARLVTRLLGEALS